MSAKKQRTAIGYVRVSVDNDTNVSPDTQKSAITEYCTRKGWALLDVASERGRSAGEGKSRPVFDDVLARIAAGDADTLVVFRLDRATRSVVDFADTIRTLNGVGAQFVSTSEGFDTTTPSGKAMLVMTVVFAELERDTISERARAHNRTLRAEGKGTNGIAAYGYRHNKQRKLVIVPAEAAWIRKMTNMVIDGMSLRHIRDALNEAGAPTPHRGVGVWRHGGVREVLVNRTIAARRYDPDNEIWVDAPWKPILSRDRWDQLQAILRDPARRTSHEKQRSLLSGIATCGKCGQPLRPSRRNARRYYRCIKSDSRPDACQGISIAADPLDDLVVNATLELLSGIEITVSIAVGGDDDLDEIDAQLDELASDWARGDISRSEWRQAREILIDRRDTTQRTQQRTNPTLAALATATNLETAWPQLDIGDQRAVLRDLYDQVSIGPARTRGDIEHRVQLTVAD